VPRYEIHTVYGEQLSLRRNLRLNTGIIKHALDMMLREFQPHHPLL
jgi:hypothetical protein